MSSMNNEITNGHVLYCDKLVNTGRFNIHGKLVESGNDSEYLIEVDPNALSAGFSMQNSTLIATPIEDFLEAKTDSYLLAVGIGLVCNGKAVLGLRPENISVAPNKLTISGGRCSEAPTVTAMKELAEEFVILATDGKEDRFVRYVSFGESGEHLSDKQLKSLQEHAIESLSYADQSLAHEWLDCVVHPMETDNSVFKTVKINVCDRGEFSISHALPCVIEEYKTIDILVPRELLMPNGWEIKKVWFLENNNHTSLVAPFNELAERPRTDFTAWAKALIDNS